MKKLKRLFALLTVSVLLLALTACGSSVSQTVLYNKDGIKITTTGMSSGTFGPELKLRIENNSGRNITVQDRNTSVNGYTLAFTDTVMSIDVQNGEVANGTLTFFRAALQRNDITSIREIKTHFHIFEMNNFGSDSIDTDTITISVR